MILCKQTEVFFILSNIKILHDFLTYLLCIKNCTKVTISDYRNDLNIFFNFLVDYLELKINVKDITVFILGSIEESTILAFLVYLNVYRNNGSNTRKRIVSSLRSFYKWLFMKYYNTLKNKINPTSNLPTIEQQQRLPKYLKYSDAIKIQSIFNSNNCRTPIRNNLIIKIFLNCGLRLSELANINISDIDFKNKTLRIVGKGNKERIIYLSKFITNVICEYLEKRDSDSNALFLNANGEKLKKGAIENICKRAFELLGVSDFNYTAHTLRHTAATYMYKNTKDILIVKDFLGHESVESTEIYTHIINEELKDAVNRNPLNFIVDL